MDFKNPFGNDIIIPVNHGLPPDDSNDSPSKTRDECVANFHEALEDSGLSPFDRESTEIHIAPGIQEAQDVVLGEPVRFGNQESRYELHPAYNPTSDVVLGTEVSFGNIKLVKHADTDPVFQTILRNRSASREGNSLEAVIRQIRTVTNLKFEVVVKSDIDGALIQAAAYYPTQELWFTEGIINLLNRDELAWVAGHEVAHLELQHSLKQQAMVEAGFQIAKNRLKAKDDKLKAGGSGSIRRGLAQAAGLAAALVTIAVSTRAYGRKCEIEADCRGLEITFEAGFNPAGALSALRKLQASGWYVSHSFLEQVWQDAMATHPSHDKRIENLRQRMQSLPWDESELEENED